MKRWRVRFEFEHTDPFVIVDSIRAQTETQATVIALSFVGGRGREISRIVAEIIEEG